MVEIIYTTDRTILSHERRISKMTFEQAFLKVKKKFEQADASGLSDFAVQVTFTDEDCGGTFYAEVKNGKLSVEPYDYYDNNAVLNISKSALLAFIAGRTSLDKAVAAGEAHVQGDASKITDWKNTIKKAPAKKTAAKKAPAKKTAAKKTTKTTPAKTTTAKAAAPAAKAEKTEEKKSPAPAAAKAAAKPTAKPAAKASAKTTK